MEVALYARVSTHQQQHEGTIESQRHALKEHMQHHGWSLLPEHEYSDDGISGARLDRPALDRLRDAARAQHDRLRVDAPLRGRALAQQAEQIVLGAPVGMVQAPELPQGHGGGAFGRLGGVTSNRVLSQFATRSNAKS